MYILQNYVFSAKRWNFFLLIPPLLAKTKVKKDESQPIEGQFMESLGEFKVFKVFKVFKDFKDFKVSKDFKDFKNYQARPS